MSTVPLTCPSCGAWIRVAAQASIIRQISPDQLHIEFDAQTVAHQCKEKK